MFCGLQFRQTEWCFSQFIFQAIQDITRSYDIPPEEIVTLIYEKIDVKGEGNFSLIREIPGELRSPAWKVTLLWTFPGELTLEEFISGAREHPDIMEMLTKMMDLTNVLEIIIKGQRRKVEDWQERIGLWTLTIPCVAGGKILPCFP